MVERREKITLKFNSYEARQLNTLQFSYLFARSRFADIPTVNEILKSMIAFSYFRIKDKRVLRRFANGFLKRRNLPPDEQVENNESELSEEEVREVVVIEKGMERKSNPIKSAELGYPTPGNFSFYTDDKEISRINIIKKMVSDYSKIPINGITNPEIVRECMHFIFDQKTMNMFYRLLTYVGSLYGLSPVTSVLTGALSRKSTYPEEVVDYVIDTTRKDEFGVVLSMDREFDFFEKFQSQFNKHWNLDNLSDIDQVFGYVYSEVGNFDFYLAFVGFDMAFYTWKYDIQEISDVFVVQRINSKKDILLIGAEMFGDYIEIFSIVATLLNRENQLPDVNQRILKWVKT